MGGGEEGRWSVQDRAASDHDRDRDADDFNPTLSELDEAALESPVPPSGEGFTITGQRFDVGPYLSNLPGRGGRYLEVKWRLLWLRTEQPGARIETEMLRLTDREAVFKATITLPGGAVGSGHGSESAGDFRDFIEKAETKAMGRALAALGYGTQFSEEFLSGERATTGQRNIVDTPVAPRPAQAQRPEPPRPAAPAPAPAPARPPAGSTAGQRRAEEETKPGLLPATERQVKFIYAVGREAGLDDEEMETWSQELYNVPIADLNRRDASTFIEALQRRRNEVA